MIRRAESKAQGGGRSCFPREKLLTNLKFDFKNVKMKFIPRQVGPLVRKAARAFPALIL